MFPTLCQCCDKRRGNYLLEKVSVFIKTSTAGSLLAVKLHSENGVILNGKYEILISLILQWQDNPRKTMRNQLSLIIGKCRWADPGFEKGWGGGGQFSSEQ